MQITISLPVTNSTATLATWERFFSAFIWIHSIHIQQNIHEGKFTIKSTKNWY